MSEDINTHGMICDFGKHVGTPYIQMPVSYLKWMVCIDHSRADIAAAELNRRGTVTPDLDVSGHAIDRASLLSPIRKVWQTDVARTPKGENPEGLHAWLVRLTAEAMRGEPDERGRYRHRGIVFCIERDGVWPVLKTVLPDKKGQKHDEAG